MNFAIVGPGAIGSLWASYLSQAGHHVCLWSRNTSPLLSIKRDDHVPITLANIEPSKLSSADVVLVTLKAPQVRDVLASLACHIHHDAIIILMHNGMGTTDAINALFPQNPLLLATTTHGAYRPTTSHVLHTGYGQTLIGAGNTLGKQCEFMVEVLNHALPLVMWQSHIEQALWNKLAVNCAINPLTALNQVRNGELAQPKYAEQLSTITDEVISVMQANGIDVDTNQLRDTIDSVIQTTANNFSSMEQDIAHRRPSEIDFITGYVIQTARDHGIDVPMNQQLYQAIKQIEKNW